MRRRARGFVVVEVDEDGFWSCAFVLLEQKPGCCRDVNGLHRERRGMESSKACCDFDAYVAKVRVC